MICDTCVHRKSEQIRISLTAIPLKRTRIYCDVDDTELSVYPVERKGEIYHCKDYKRRGTK